MSALAISEKRGYDFLKEVQRSYGTWRIMKKQELNSQTRHKTN